MLEKKIKIFKDEFPQNLLYLKDGYIYYIKLETVIEERCDELDYQIEDEGYSIIYQDYERVATSIYNYTVYFS